MYNDRKDHQQKCNEKDDLRDRHGRRRNATKTEHGSHNCDNEKHKSPSKHLFSPFQLSENGTDARLY